MVQFVSFDAYSSFKLKMTIVLVITLFGSFIIPDEPIYKYYNENSRLTWADFQGSVPENPQFGAISSLDLKTKFNSENEFTYININSCFLPSESWAVENMKSLALLNHEQRHFDIVEIHARIYRKYMYMYYKGSDIITYIKHGNDSIVSEMDKMQAIYDKETNLSRDSVQQLKWNRKIDSLLEAYSGYTEPQVKIARN